MTHHTERPCAAAGLTSYRYGSIMIGATSTRGALIVADGTKQKETTR